MNQLYKKQLLAQNLELFLIHRPKQPPTCITTINRRSTFTTKQSLQAINFNNLVVNCDHFTTIHHNQETTETKFCLFHLS